MEDLRHLHTMTSPDDDTSRDSVRDIAREQRDVIGSLGSMRLGRLSGPSGVLRNSFLHSFGRAEWVASVVALGVHL